MSANPYISSTEITVKGTTIKRVNHLQINQKFETHHNFEISISPKMLPDKSIKLQALADNMVGEEITIKLTQSRKDAADQTMTFIGIVMNVRLIKGQAHSNTFLISGTSPTVILSAGRTTRSFSDKKLKDIADAVLKPFDSLQKDVQPAFSGPVPYITQYEEDNFHFLQRLAEKYGEWMYYDGKKFIFGKSGRTSIPAVELVHGTNFFDMEYGVRVTPLNFNAYYYNYSHEKFWSEAKSEDATVNGLQPKTMAHTGYDKSKKLFKDPLFQFDFHEDESALQQAVKLKKSKQSNKLAIMQGRTQEIGIKLGGLVKVKDEFHTATNAKQGSKHQNTTDYGSFSVTQLSHSLDSKGVYWATFEAVPHDADFAPVDYRIVAPIAHPRIAIVRKVDDEGKMGRVKVEFLWHDTDQTTPWIRVSQLMTGADRGVYFVPEVSESVFVDFEFGDPDLPFVTGSFYRKKNALPGPLFDKDNHIKGIITKGGNHILINDESGKENISIYNKDKKNILELSLDGDTTITIKSEGKINIEAKDTITMKAKKIEFTADEEWKVKAGKSEIKNDQGMEITAGTELKIQSTSVKVKGDASVEIEADASASLKSKTLVDIESNAMTIVKGMPVLIN